MKRMLLCLLVLAVGVNTIFAQVGDGPARQRLEAQRVAHITRAVDLTPEESEKFWPVYNQCKAEERKMRQETRRENGGKRPGGLSEEEAEEILNAQTALQDDIVKHRRACMERLKPIIGAKKIIRLQAAERAFNKRVLEAIKKRRARRNK